MKRWRSLLLRISSLFVISASAVGCFNKSAPVVLVDVREAPEYRKAKRLQFAGEPHFEWVGVHRWKTAPSGGGPPNSGKEMWRHVVPVTGAGWDKTKPIPLWVSISSSRKNVSTELASLQRALDAGEIIGKVMDFPSRTVGALRGVSAWQQAVASAETQHGLRSDPKAPIVVWEP